jgi:hypothetical protein
MDIALTSPKSDSTLKATISFQQEEVTLQHSNGNSHKLEPKRNKIITRKKRRFKRKRRRTYMKMQMTTTRTRKSKRKKT